MPTIQLHAPHDAQAKVLTEARRFNVIACGRRWGKTDMCMDSVAIPCALDGYPAGWFAPTYKLLGEAWDHAISCLLPLRSSLEINKADRFIKFPTGGIIEFWSTEPAIAGDTESDVARGRHYKEAIYDEFARARRPKADWTKAIRPTLADLKGRAWFPSTPKGQNYFHHLWLRGQQGEQDWASWQMPTSTNPLIEPDEIESARRELPADAFEQEWEAKFLANAANPFRIDAIRSCIVNGVPKGPVAWWGVDLAKSQDWTVAIGLNADGGVCAFERWQSDWRATRARLIAMLRNAPAFVDETGVGNPIVEDLNAATGTITGYPFTAQSKQQLMEGLAYAIQNKTLKFPQSILVDELESFQYEYKAGGRVSYNAPEGLHDDCVCALALAVECRGKAVPFTFSEPAGIAVGTDRFASDYDVHEDDAIWSEA